MDLDFDKNIAVAGTNSMKFTNSTAQKVKWDKYIIHETFNTTFFGSDDIAIIKLSEPFNISVDEQQFTVNTICLPNQNQSEQNRYAIEAGWGRTSLNGNSPAMLQEAKFLILNEYQCKTVFWESMTMFTPEEMGINASLIPSLDELRAVHEHLTDTRICLMASVPPGTGHKHTHTMLLQGDSGSPMLQYFDNDRAHVMGINSFAYAKFQTNPLMLLAKVSLYIDWIKEKINEM